MGNNLNSLLYAYFCFFAITEKENGFIIAVDFGVNDDVNGVSFDSVELEAGGMGGDFIEREFQLDQNDNVEGNGIPHGVPTISLINIEEPYVGQEFDSEGAAHAFYNDYAKMAGFLIRVSKLSRSKRDGTPIGRALVCNKEGFRLPDKREKIIRRRVDTRTGCRAMISMRKVRSGKWVVTKFVKEHNHPLTLNLIPEKPRRENLFEQYPNEHAKIRELTLQLAEEKKRSANYKKQLDLLFKQFEELDDILSKKIKHVLDTVEELENNNQENPGI